MLNGVEVGDVHGIGHDTARRRSPARPHRNAVVFAVLNKVGHDEEVAGKPHGDNGLHLVVEALFVDLLVHIGVLLSNHRHAAVKAFSGDLSKEVVGGEFVGGIKQGEVVGLEIELHIAAIGNLNGV